EGNMLIGVLSTPPDTSQKANSSAHDWFGSPAIPLPRRQESTPFPPELTIHPKRRRKLARGTVEFIRIILPESAIICFSILFIAYGHDLVVDEPLFSVLLLVLYGYPGIFADCDLEVDFHRKVQITAKTDVDLEGLAQRSY